ncbi:MAG: 2-dehydropantoate 2-reductase [Pseudomonadota bacterium]
MRVAVIGAGALGTFFAARLAAAGHEVGVVARGGRLAAIRQRGLRLVLGDAPITLVVPAAEDLTALPPPELAIIATKTADLSAAIALLAHCTGAGSAVLTVQNGVEAPDAVAAALPAAHVLAGRVHGFFELTGDIVRHVGVTPSLAFGPWRADAADAADQLEVVLTGAGIAWERPAGIAAALWEKLVLASSIGGIGAVLGLPTGAILNDAAHAALLEGMMREVAAVAAARGVTLTADCVKRTLAFVGSFPECATSSLQRDLLAQRPSEFAALTGAIPRLAAAAGVAVPLHDTVISRLRAQGLV